MQPVTVLFAPGVDAALLELVDHVDVDSIPTVLDFLDWIQARLVKTLSTLPEAGSIFQGEGWMFPVDGYVSLCQYREDVSKIHVLDLIAPGQNWRCH